MPENVRDWWNYCKFVRNLWTGHLADTCMHCGMVQVLGGVLGMADSILRDPDKVRESIAEAVEIAQSKGIPMTMARVAACTGIALSTLTDLVNGKVENKDAHPDSIELIKKAYLAAQADIIDAGFTIRNWAFCIYAAKSMHNLQDKTEDGRSVTNNIVFVGEDKIPD